MAWIRVESKSRAGKYYYYHRESKASTWKMPPDYKVRILVCGMAGPVVRFINALLMSPSTTSQKLVCIDLH